MKALALPSTPTAAATATARHPWEFDTSLNYGTPVNFTATGYSFEVVRDGSPYGSGWGLSIQDQLVAIPADTVNNYPAGELLV